MWGLFLRPVSKVKGCIVAPPVRGNSAVEGKKRANVAAEERSTTRYNNIVYGSEVHSVINGSIGAALVTPSDLMEISTCHLSSRPSCHGTPGSAVDSWTEEDPEGPDGPLPR